MEIKQHYVDVLRAYSCLIGCLYNDSVRKLCVSTFMFSPSHWLWYLILAQIRQLYVYLQIFYALQQYRNLKLAGWLVCLCAFVKSALLSVYFMFLIPFYFVKRISLHNINSIVIISEWVSTSILMKILKIYMYCSLYIPTH